MYKKNLAPRAIGAPRLARPPRPVAVAMPRSGPRAVPHKACEPGEPCHALSERRERLAAVLREALVRTRALAAATSADGADYTQELRHAWDTIEEISAALRRLDVRLDDCRAEYDYLRYADADLQLSERAYDL